MKKLFCLSLLFFIIASMTQAQNDTISAANPMIQYSGRVDFSNPEAPRFDWSGISITAAFHGTSIGFLLEDGGNNYNVMVDGLPNRVWETNASQTLYTVDNLTPSDHVVKIVKRTESMFGPVTFKGLVLSPGGVLSNAPAPPSRRVELIGDSYLCGYGVEAVSIKCDSLRPYENAEKAFGSLAAQDLNAEYHLESFSGKGVVRNWGDPKTKSVDPFPALYDRVVCGDVKSFWDFAKWTPNVVIVHLGFNDFSSPPGADRKEFSQGYVAFLKHIREKYPKSFIFCVAPDGWPTPLSTTVDEVVEKRHSAGDKNVQLITYPPVAPDEMGCDSHPNTVAQRKIADVVTAAIKTTMDW
jgi:hypothetical protein